MREQTHFYFCNSALEKIRQVVTIYIYHLNLFNHFLKLQVPSVFL